MQPPSRKGEVPRAQRAFAASPDARRIKVELEAGNRYVAAKLTRVGLIYESGAIRRKEAGDGRP